jgi:hypothetical protein
MMLEHFAGLLESARHQSHAPRVIFLMPPWGGRIDYVAQNPRQIPPPGKKNL